ncbi:antitoxin [Candidatus Pacearchaeota archaeon ex4484_26]|nr:MAG: antitoxin [Candidatus Pacearchaeota archaeon ex4484_26]RLF35166.1 MAG: antitoxin [Thermoplasmata archaeon]
MPKAIVELDEKANRIVNIVKAKYGMRDKSEAINKITEDYGEEILEPALKPEWVEKMKRVMKEKAIKVGNVKNLRKRYEK